MMSGFYKRLKDEISYLRNKNWTLTEMGQFWDNLEEYDDINSKIYPYQMRFLNSKKMIDEINIKDFKPNNCLDIQTRTGNGTIFWSKEFPTAEYFIADFSKNFLEKSKNNLKERNINFKDFFIEKFPLPFSDSQFDFTISYETIEHVANYENFFSVYRNFITYDNAIIKGKWQKKIIKKYNIKNKSRSIMSSFEQVIHEYKTFQSKIFNLFPNKIVRIIKGDFT